MSGPLLVVGSMGSGTTLIRLMLDSHPDIMIAQETGFLRSVNAQYFSPFWLFGDRFANGMGLSAEQFDAHVRTFYDAVFSEAARLRGAKIWGDKTPFHVHLMPLAARVFPEARFLATMRHPGAVLVSMRRFGWSASQAISHWLRIQQALADQAAALGDRICFARYEDLVSQPEQVMTEVLRSLDLPWDDAVLRHNEIQAGSRFEGGTRGDRAVDRTRIGAWVDELPENQARELDDRAGAAARLWGYDIRSALPVEPLVPLSERLSAPGSTVASHQRTFTDIPRIDVPQSFENGPLTPEAMAAELAQAWSAGTHMRQIRFPYRKYAETERGVAPPDRSFIARVRRRLARMIHPEW